jgi:lysophospholipase L1-like esterase
MSASRRFLYALLATLLGCAAIEALARVVEPWVTPPAATLPTPAPGPVPAAFETRMRADRSRMQVLPMVASEREGWALAPHEVRQEGSITIRVNSLGLRGPELGPPARDEVRILTVGDSSIFGLGVPEVYVFSTVAAAKLAATWARPVTPVIGGIPGYDSGQSRSQLEVIGPQVAPRWVVIANLWSDLYRVDPDHPLRSAVEPARALATWRVLRIGLAPWLLTRKVGWAERRESIGDEGTTRVSLADYVANLEAMVATTRSSGARPVFLVLPAPLDIDPAPVPETVAAFRLAMTRVAQRAGAPVLDGPALFRAHHVGLGYWNDQVHPSAEGHAVLGEGLAALLGPLGP